MPVELSVTLDPRNLAKFRTLLKAQPKMAAQSLTFTAERAQRDWRAGQSVFHRRNTWIDKGVRIRAATPGNLVSQVGTIDKFLGRHVKGVDEPKVSAGSRLFVPVYGAIANVPAHQRIRARLRQMEGTRRKPFTYERGGETFLARRLTKERGPLQILATLRKSVDIAPRLDAFGIVERTVNREFASVYGRLLDKWSREGFRG